MDWHKDDPLYDQPQCELVIVLDNSSDSETCWEELDGTQHAEWTPANSALLIRAGETGARHRVKPLKRGERTILKMVWASPSASPLSSFFSHLDSFPGLRARQRPSRSKTDKRDEKRGRKRERKR